MNGLNADGEYVFSLTKKTSITVGGQKFADIAVSPEAGTLKSLGEIKVTVPMIGNGESMLYTSPENIAKITLTSKDGLVLHGSEIGEPAMNADETGFEFPITFESAASTAGEYTLEIPAGTFYEVAWDDTAEAFVGVAGGTVSQAFTAKYTVDPTYTAKIDTYTLIPASGSALKSIEKIYLNLTEYTVYDMVQLGHEYATITNGTKSYMCEIGYDWNNMDCRGFEISILDDNYDPQALSEAGTWTLSIEAGTFSFDGESSQAIEAHYTIGASLPVYPLSPVPGTVTGNLSKLTITFPGATEVEYDESKAITLTGKDFSATAAAVGQKAKSAAEQLIQFATTPLVAGEYTVAIPAGAFTVDGEPSEAVTATFTYEPLWKLTPAPEATVESLDEITLEFPNAKQASFDGSRWSFILTNGGSYAATGYDCTEVEGASHPTFKLTLDGESQRPPFGILQFIIDEGAFTVDGEASPEIRCTYVLEGTISNNYEVTPNNGVITYNEWGAMFAFVFDEQAVVTSTSAFATKAKATVNGKELTFDTDYMAMPEGNYLLMQVGNPEYLIDGATLRVVLEAGAFEVNGEPSPAIDESWVLQAPKGYTFTITPEDGDVVNNLKTIHVGFPEATTAELFNEYGIWLAQTTGYGYRETPTVILLSSADYPVFELSFDTPPTVAQEYTLTCRQGTFTLDGSQESPEIIATFKYDPTSGIYDVEFGGATCVTVVTLDGKVLLDKAPAADLDTLPAGVYIINGVKTLKK